MGAGCRMVIAPGKPVRPLSALRQGGHCTWFLPGTEVRAARKSWIAASVKPNGILTVDDGAVTALLSGKSLLPAGVVDVSGMFERGDTVEVRSKDGRVIGRGLSAYNVVDVRLIMGHRSEEIEALLGFRGRSEVIHRDDLAVI
jgi:glutamate 5-kinase